MSGSVLCGQLGGGGGGGGGGERVREGMAQEIITSHSLE